MQSMMCHGPKNKAVAQWSQQSYVFGHLFGISCWQPWLFEGWKAPTFGHFGFGESAKSTGRKRQAGIQRYPTEAQLIQLFGTWKGQPHLRTRSMARLWSYVVKSCCMERKKTWIDCKVEAAWTSGQRHRPRSLSSHRVDSHASTVDIHGHLRPLERRTSRARVVCLVSVCFHGLQKVLLGRDLPCFGTSCIETWDPGASFSAEHSGFGGVECVQLFNVTDWWLIFVGPGDTQQVGEHHWQDLTVFENLQRLPAKVNRKVHRLQEVER